MKCPKCGSLEPFNIGCHAMLEVTDDGTDIAKGYDIEWDNDDTCVCKSCDHLGVVQDFKIQATRRKKK